MPQRVNQLDLVATDLAQWIDSVANEITLAMKGGASAPFAARVTAAQQLDYYTHQMFNPDGSPNQAGRNKELARLGATGFRQAYDAVIKAHPELKPPEEDQPQLPPPPEPGSVNPAPPMPMPSAPETGPGAMLPPYQPPQFPGGNP